MMNDFSSGALAEVSDALYRREISPVELVRAHIDWAREVNKELNCLITAIESQAISAARLAEGEILRGGYRGPLHGIPFTAKDIFASAGTRTTAGSKILADWVPSKDATVIQQLTDAGAILVAKTNLSEFAAGPTNSNEHYGPARNPWNPGRITGGSSGGSAAAVAAGIGFFSLGTDTGGSVRIPASLSGVLGLKPTFGCVSRRGVLPLSSSLDTVGIFSRGTDDAAKVFEVLCRQSSGDGSAAPDARPGPAEPTLEGTRIGLPREMLLDPCDAEVRESFLAAVRLLEQLGAHVEEVSFPWGRYAPSVVNLITWAESAALHRQWFVKRAAAYGRHMRDQILIGSAIGAADYLQAVQVRRMISARSAELLRKVDIVALPTVAIAAPAIAESYDPAVLAALRQFTRLASCTGQPALSIPCGFTSDAMPIGLQLLGKHREERQLLAVAHAYEQARGLVVPCPRVRPDHRSVSDSPHTCATSDQGLLQ